MKEFFKLFAKKESQLSLGNMTEYFSANEENKRAKKEQKEYEQYLKLKAKFEE